MLLLVCIRFPWRFFGLFLLLSSTACVDVVAPDFRFRDGFVFVEGEISNEVGFSRLRLQTSRITGSRFELIPLTVSQVQSIDGAGQIVDWQEAVVGSGYYLPPTDYAGTPGESYAVRILTQDGRMMHSSPEILPAPVPFENLRMQFDQEAYYSEALRRFVPAFRFLVDFQDPTTHNNYYRFRHQTWEKLDVCVTCRFSRFNRSQGACVSDNTSQRVARFDYPCLGECWENAINSEINLFSDRFVNGNRVEAYEAARIPWEWYGGLLVIVEQQQLTERAHAFNEVIKGISIGSAGLNATLPAALVGNVAYENSDEEETVLGYFAAVGTTSDRLYFNRDTVQGNSLFIDNRFNFDTPPPPGVIYMHPCEEANRSPIRPLGWPN